ncbi:MAG: hypothetical protein K6A40_01210 [Solobacterium sp.]|nr:hypothetical protein [Solobacterium sp.]
MKKIFISSLCVLFFITAFVSAKAKNQVASYLYGNELNNETIELLEEAGVPITDKTRVELRSVVNSSKSGNVLLVTNYENESVRKDIVSIINEDGELAISNLEELAASVSSTQIPYTGEKLTFTATAYYYRYFNPADFSDHYIRPKKVSFSWSKKTNVSLPNVTKIYVNYVTDGYQYSYPGFTDLNLPEYVWSISRTKTNPSVNTVYSSTNEYRSDRVIWVGGSSWGLGSNMYVTFNIYIDGILSDYYTVIII